MSTDRLQHCQKLGVWFESKLGRQVLSAERAVVQASLPSCFGTRQLEIGVESRYPVAKTAEGCCHWFSTLARGRGEPSLVALPEELPFQNDALDTVILHHTLDLSPYPHQTLREAYRVLRPGGQLRVVGFNPWSLWGMRRQLGLRRGDPWRLKFISPRRMTDWLHLLGLELAPARFGFYRPPTQHPWLLEKLEFMERASGSMGSLPLGGIYVLGGEKRTLQMIRLREHWRHRENVVNMPLANREARMKDGYRDS